MAAKKNTNGKRVSGKKSVAVKGAPRRGRAKAAKSVEKVHTGGSDNGYPFLTKTQIREKIVSDPKFAVECLMVMHDRQTDAEQESGRTTARNRSGLMSSHAVRATALANEAKEHNGKLTGEKLEQTTAIVVRYTKQLAAHFRDVARGSDPELAKKASLFGL